MITGRYANVIVDISHEKVDRPFQYKIPERLMGKLSPGMCVEIPFGNGSRFRQGYVIEVTDKPEYAPENRRRLPGSYREEFPCRQIRSGLLPGSGKPMDLP